MPGLWGRGLSTLPVPQLRLPALPGLLARVPPGGCAALQATPRVGWCRGQSSDLQVSPGLQDMPILRDCRQEAEPHTGLLAGAQLSALEAALAAADLSQSRSQPAEVLAKSIIGLGQAGAWGLGPCSPIKLWVVSSTCWCDLWWCQPRSPLPAGCIPMPAPRSHTSQKWGTPANLAFS